jgi:exosome complex RNA-binding protein Rrp4
VPAPQESVVGVVAGRVGDGFWRVDIGGAHFAMLDALAFEGASKRNRPALKVNIYTLSSTRFLSRKQGGILGLREGLVGP